MASTYLPKRGKVFAVKIDAGNDRNGNPRRGWLIYDNLGSFWGFVDEGYYGHSALKECCPKAVELCTIPTTPGVYRDAMKDRR